MADITVDEKPKEKLPYDPNDIPEAVRKRAAAVDALYNGSAGEKPAEAAPESQAPANPPEAPAPQAPVQPATPSQATAPSAPAGSADENDQSWKHRYLAMQGRYNATQKTIGEMQEQMMQLGNELMHAQQTPQREAPPQTSQQAYLTEKDLQDYGPELINVTQRAALQAIAPQMQAVEQQNAELRQRLAVEARRRLDQTVEMAVPNYRDIDRNPRWHRWLLGIDVLSGRVRQQLLNEAISAASAPRVISFFRGFQQEETATGHIEPAPSSQQPAAPREPVIPLASLASPGRARPATGGDTSFPPDKPIYTRAQVRDYYRAHQKGAYVGREAEWNRQDADIIAAGREGRIR